MHEQPQEVVAHLEQLQQFRQRINSAVDVKMVLIVILLVTHFFRGGSSPSEFVSKRLRDAEEHLQTRYEQSLAEMRQSHERQLKDLRNQHIVEEENLALAYEQAKSNVRAHFESEKEDLDTNMRKIVSENFKVDFEKEQHVMLKGIIKDRDVHNKLLENMPPGVSVGKLVYNSSSDGLSLYAFDKGVHQLKEALCIIKTNQGEIIGAYTSLVTKLLSDTHFIFLIEKDGQMKVQKEKLCRYQRRNEILSIETQTSFRFEISDYGNGYMYHEFFHK